MTRLPERPAPASLLERIPAPLRSTRGLAVTAGALLLAGLSVAGLLAWQARREAAAATAYAQALVQVLGAGAEAPAAPPEALQALEAVVADYPSAPVTAQAAFTLGNLRARAAGWPGARAAYATALAAGAEGTLRTLALAGTAQAWEAEGNFIEAVEAYRQALEGVTPAAFFYTTGMLGLARAQEAAGNRPAAVETLKRLLQAAPASPAAGDVRAHLARLGVAP